MTCAEITPLLELTPLLADDVGGAQDLLQDAELQALDEHLASCAACRAKAEELSDAYGLWTEAREHTMKPLSTELRDRVLDDAKQKTGKTGKAKGVVVAEPAADPAKVEAVRAKVVLSCSFCHDGMHRDDSVFCASCLAPHHRECFVDHKHCSMPGCEETRTVRPSEASETQPPVRKPRRGRGWIIMFVASLTGVGGGIAAWTGYERDRDRAAAIVTKIDALEAAGDAKLDVIDTLVDATPAEDLPPGELAPGPQTNQPWDDPPPPDPEFDRGLKPSARPKASKADGFTVTSTAGRVTLDVERPVSLAAVMRGISSATSLNVIVDSAVKETVMVSLRDIPADEAIDVIARMTRCEVERLPGSILFLDQPPKVTIQFQNGNIRTILKLLADYSGKNVYVGPNVKGMVQVDLKEVHWKRALQAIVKSAKLHVAWQGGSALVTAAPLPASELSGKRPQFLDLPPEEAAKAPRISLDVDGDLEDVSDQIGRDVYRSILVDPYVKERVAVVLSNVKWHDAVTALCHLTGTEVEERPGGVALITQPPRITLAARRAPATALYGLLAAYSGKNITINEDVRDGVTVDLKNEHWLRALRHLALVHGHKITPETEDLLMITRGDWVKGWEAPATVTAAPTAFEKKREALLDEIAELARKEEHDTLSARQAELRELLKSDAAKATPVEERPRSELLVTAVLVVDAALRTSSAAIVNGQVVREGGTVTGSDGDPIEGLTVKVIKATGVVFKRGRETFERTLD